MDCSGLPQPDPTANPNPNPYPNANPNPYPNPYLYPQPQNTHSVPFDASYQYYTSAPADPSNATFLPQFQPQQPSIHYPYAPPPPGSVLHAPLQFVSSGSHPAPPPYYPDPIANTTFAAGHFVPGAPDYAAINGVATPSSINFPKKPVNQKKGTKKNKKKKKTKPPVPHAWCEVCNIDCTSRDVLSVHILGKKHQKALEKLKLMRTFPPPPLSAPSPAAAIHLPPTIATSTPIIGPQLPSPVAAAASSASADEPTIEPRAPPPSINAASSTPMAVATSALTDPPAVGPRAPSPPIIATSNPFPSPEPISPKDEPIIGPQESQSPTVATSNPLLVLDPTSPRDEPTVGPQGSQSPIVATSNPVPVSEPTSPGDEPIMGPQESPTVATSNPVLVSDPTSPRDEPIVGPQESLTVATSNPLLVPGVEPIMGPQVPPSAAASSSAALAPASTGQPFIGPPVARVSRRKGSKKRGRVVASIEDFEKKRRKVVENGTSAEDVHVCGVCNIVCNSETVMRGHLAGRKHALAAAKKLASSGAAATT